MSDNSKLEGLVKTAMEKVHEMVDCETIVGKPIVTADGTTIIPISKVSFGFASGGSDLPTKSTKDQFGGGSGAGITISPVAFIAISNGETKLLQMTTNTPYENAVVNVVPDVVDKIIDFVDKKTTKDETDE
ncbi:MAG: GerW family sporulation protein [Ruminococcus sp.]|nr:GerW family sporulation protein [Ruminococcus sp.]